MMSVFKYQLPDVRGEINIALPLNAVVLSCGDQEGPVLWALVDTNAPSEPRLFRLLQTGQGFDERRPIRFIGTIQRRLSGGLDQYVLHLFEITVLAMEPPAPPPGLGPSHG